MTQKLELTWVAKFEDGTLMRQFDDAQQQLSERKFKELQDYPSKLILFQLTNVKTNRVYQVDLRKGTILTFTAPDCYTALEADTAKEAEHIDYRLIYFRRVTLELQANLTQIVNAAPKGVLYFLGYQYTNCDGKNIKKVLQISHRDEVYVV